LAVVFWGFARLPGGRVALVARGLWVRTLPWRLVMGWRFQSWRHSPALCLSGLFLLTRAFRRQPPGADVRGTVSEGGAGWR
ncbi:ComEC family protein, partial [Klebsiella pneumoniae]|nr:ComEC family protein [Klebsiella pneumoniae]